MNGYIFVRFVGKFFGVKIILEIIGKLYSNCIYIF